MRVDCFWNQLVRNDYYNLFDKIYSDIKINKRSNCLLTIIIVKDNVPYFLEGNTFYIIAIDMIMVIF